MKPKTIYESKNKVWRIIEIEDLITSIDDLKGEGYDPKVNTNIPAEQLLKEEREFELKAFNYGIYGYALEKWNPLPGIGYEHVDSCFGFVGRYDSNEEEFNHYIVEEFKTQIEGEEK